MCWRKSRSDDLFKRVIGCRIEGSSVSFRGRFVPNGVNFCDEIYLLNHSLQRVIRAKRKVPAHRLPT